MPDHPYQPGTVWAPKQGKAAPRRVTDRPSFTMSIYPDDAPVIWYWQRDTRGNDWLGESTPRAFRRWAGEILDGCPAGHGEQCCGHPKVCLDA